MPRAGWQWKSFSRFLAGKDWNEQPVTRQTQKNTVATNLFAVHCLQYVDNYQSIMRVVKHVNA
jgi:hypothetical protein